MKSKTKNLPEMTVNVRFLGGFSMEKDGISIGDDLNRSQKIWSVLSYLVVHRDRTVPQSEFIDAFWPDERGGNPVNALKTLLYRVRATLEPLFGTEFTPVVSQRGSYSWSPSVKCAVDADRFEELCVKAEDPALTDYERIHLYAEAMELYKGDFLPKLSDQFWVISRSAHYHQLYLAAVKDYAALLDKTEEYEKMTELCTVAADMDPLDETVHILLIRSLLRQGKDQAALAHYESTTELLYRNLGVRPSDELQELYTEIMAVEKNLETDLEAIQEELKETAARPGAFVCEYGFFREAYRLEARRAARNGTCVHVGLITVSQPNGLSPALKVLNQTMDQLLEVLVSNLRRGDVVSKYSGAQYVVMLPAANFEDSSMVMDRIVNAFYRQHRRNFLKLSCKLRELELV